MAILKKGIYYVLLVTFSSLLIYILASIILAYIPVNKTPLACKDSTSIYVSSNGMHVDLILPKRAVAAELRNQLKLPPQAKYVSIGWGDKGFYLDTPTWAELKFSTACEAMLINSETAMHVTYFTGERGSWKTAEVCADNLAALNQYISASFQKDANGAIDEIEGAGYGKTDRFYEAIGNYNAIKTCNIWANRGLKIAGVQTGVWTPFEFGVMWHFPDKVKGEK
ncbi:MAG: TIGR02117 family protein [Saprospiraceae bacterium]